MAAVLRLQPEEVVHHRAAALDRLAADLGIYDDAERARLSDLLAELPAEEWPDDTANGKAEAAPAGQRPAEPPAVGRSARRRGAQAARGAEAGQAQAAAGGRSWPPVVIVVGAHPRALHRAGALRRRLGRRQG